MAVGEEDGRVLFNGAEVKFRVLESSGAGWRVVTVS